MDIRAWYKKRGMKFLYYRGKNLLRRYSLFPNWSEKRINNFVDALLEVNCPPTFFVPGFLFQQNPSFFVELQKKGVEIGVHGYYHINLNSIPVDQAHEQLTKAATVLSSHGIEVSGFRCPYLGCSDEIIKSFVDHEYLYSSNTPIVWSGGYDLNIQDKNLLFTTISKFYTGKHSSEVVSFPYMKSKIIEIPLFVPDDLQLHDGLDLDSDEIAEAWIQMFTQLNQRGELFTIMFHTEQAQYCTKPMVKLIEFTKKCSPSVWTARLCDISRWYSEKSKFSVKTAQNSESLNIAFECTPRATILLRGIQPNDLSEPWDRKYQRLKTNTIDIPLGPRPFIGLAADVTDPIVDLLSDQGYIIERGENASLCSVFLNDEVLSQFSDEAALVNFIESSDSPLVRYWRWPDGAKSAISLTGDLDALSLFDYFSRFLAA